MKRTRAVGAFFSIGVILAGCIGGGLAASTPAGAATSGGSITIYGIFDMTAPPGGVAFPQNGTGFNAAVKAINASGGINGRKINGVVCDDQVNTTAAATCAHNAVSAGAAAVVEFSQEIETIDPVINAANIPLIELPLASSQLSEPNLYEIELGAVGDQAGYAVAQVKYLHSKKNSFAYPDLPAAGAAVPAWNDTFKAHGWPTGKAIAVPIPVPDPTPYAAAAVSGGTKAVAITLGAGENNKLIIAIRQSGSNVPIIQTADAESADQVKALGKYASNTYLLSGLVAPSVTSNKTVQNYIRQMNAVDPKAQKDAFSESAWTEVYLFAQAAKLAPSVTASGVETALNDHTFNLGVLPPVQFKTPVPACGEPRCFNVGETIYGYSGSGSSTNILGGKFFPVYGNTAPAKPAGQIG
jgi:ABC-type branched-subunit amino acid transport system substrate-binding protein